MSLKLHYHFFIVVGLLFDTSIIAIFKQFFSQINHSACNVLYVPEEARDG